MKLSLGAACNEEVLTIHSIDPRGCSNTTLYSSSYFTFAILAATVPFIKQAAAIQLVPVAA